MRRLLCFIANSPPSGWTFDRWAFYSWPACSCGRTRCSVPAVSRWRTSSRSRTRCEGIWRHSPSCDERNLQCFAWSSRWRCSCSWSSATSSRERGWWLADLVWLDWSRPVILCALSELLQRPRQTVSWLVICYCIKWQMNDSEGRRG